MDTGRVRALPCARRGPLALRTKSTSTSVAYSRSSSSTWSMLRSDASAIMMSSFSSFT